MMIKKNKSVPLYSAAFAASAALLLLFGKECCSGAVSGIKLCLEVLVPSIFPFTVLSVFTAESGLSEAMGRVTGKACGALFNVSGRLSAVMIMSMLGGYPVGARGIAALRKRGAISLIEAQKAAYIAVGAGPGFLINFVGSGLLRCREIGACMLIAQVISVIILGNLNRIVFRNSRDYNSDTQLKATVLPFSDALTESVISSTYAMLELSGTVIVFSALLGIIKALTGTVYKYISVLLEVTNACSLLAGDYSIALIAFAVGFGGLCVHFQVFTALKGIRLNIWLFFLYRIIQGIITALLTLLFIKIFNISLPVFSSFTQPPELALSTSAAGSVMLILCGLGFLFSIKKQ